MERKSYKVEMKASVDKREIEGYASIFGNVDSHNDVTMAGAFSKSIASDFAAPGTGQKNRVKVLWQHMHNEPIGRPVALSEDSQGLHFKAILSKGVQRADEALILIDDGVIDEMSFGYDTIEHERGQVIVDGAQKNVRMLKTLKLWEISPVTWGSNPHTDVLRAKAISSLSGHLKAGKVDFAEFLSILDELRAMVAEVANETGDGDETDDGDDNDTSQEKSLVGVFSEFNNWINQRITK